MSDPSKQISLQVTKVQLADFANDRTLHLDEVESTLPIIDLTHHMVHDGYHFTVAVVDTDVDIAGPKYVRITAPNTATRIHLDAIVSADAACTVGFYEDPTLNAAGAALTEYNNDRNSAVAATATTFEDTTTQAPNNDGTLLFAFRVGGTGVGQTRISGSMSTRVEWILDQNGTYLIKVTADADDTLVIIVLIWYEVV